MPDATDKSYEVHVAKLAGVHEAVIKRANEVLRRFKGETGIDPLAGWKRGRRSSKYTQLILFEQPGGETGPARKADTERPVAG